MQQFKLTYRKIYGLVNFIGLAERDRFELSGSDLEEWLAEPGKGKEILLRNLGGDYADKASNVEEISSAGKAKPAGREAKIRSSVERESVAQQVSIFEFDRTVPLSAETEPGATDLSHSDFYERKRPMIDHLVNEPFSDIPIDWILAGFGFEKRTLESVRRLCQAAKPRQALTVQYREPGRTDEIKVALAKSTVNYRVFEYSDVIKRGLPEVDGNVVVDITGLTKPVIFHAIRNELRRKRRVWICHTEAQSYYPLDADLERVLTAEANQDQHVLLEELRGVLTGEEGPYESDKLLPSDSDETRQRVLCAFSSPKHERLLSLLDKRDYDRIEIVGPRMDSPRSKVAQIAAEVAARNNANSNVTRIDSNDLDGVLAFIIDRYMWCYLDRGLNFEFGLTGSKLQAVACAATSAAFKISQCWYLRPEKFDRDRFTKGVGKTHYYKISLEK